MALAAMSLIGKSKQLSEILAYAATPKVIA